MNLHAGPITHSSDALVWEDGRQRIVVSPADGGRVTSWRHHRRGELVKQPQGLDGGLARVLVAPERYPGSSYVTPHIVLERDSGPDGFRIGLRYAWNTPGAFARILGWPDKACPSYLDGLVLDKTLSFDAATDTLTVGMRFANRKDQALWINPWLQSQFDGWIERSFVAVDGTPEPFLWMEQFWAGHRAREGRAMRLVQSSADGELWAILGADVGWLDGMASYTKADFGPQSTDGVMELRGKAIRIEPGCSLVCNAFIALAEGADAWRRWATASPEPLAHRLESAVPRWDEDELLPLLEHWALPEEAAAGAMILSHNDKLPFSAARRYSANQQFAGFRRRGGAAEATAWLYALRDLTGITAQSALPPPWSLGPVPATLARGNLAKLVLDGPVSLQGHKQVQVRLDDGATEIAALRTAPEPSLISSPRDGLRQTSAYLDDRYRDERACFSGTSVEELRAWQARRRRLFRDQARASIARPAPLEARVTERQEGPTCVRERILLRTERAMWIPLYAVKPIRLAGAGPLPAVLFLCGSGPGKSDMVPDETPDAQAPEHDGKWPSPYAIANRTGCLVFCPDRRGWGELAEGNHSQQPGRARAAGYSIGEMGMWDHLRVADYVCGRPDVDARHVFAMGSSGGGATTQVLLGGHERIAGGIVSSAPPNAASIPEHFFFRAEPRELPALRTDAALVQIGAPRPVWIMDGLWDRCALPALPVSDDERRAIFERWQRAANEGRDAIRRVYRLLEAESCFRSSWFDGDHLAGFHYRHIREWLLHYWPAAFTHKLER